MHIFSIIDFEEFLDFAWSFPLLPFVCDPMDFKTVDL